MKNIGEKKMENVNYGGEWKNLCVEKCVREGEKVCEDFGEGRIIVLVMKMMIF